MSLCGRFISPIHNLKFTHTIPNYTKWTKTQKRLIAQPPPESPLRFWRATPILQVRLRCDFKLLDEFPLWSVICVSSTHKEYIFNISLIIMFLTNYTKVADVPLVQKLLKIVSSLYSLVLINFFSWINCCHRWQGSSGLCKKWYLCIYNDKAIIIWKRMVRVWKVTMLIILLIAPILSESKLKLITSNSYTCQC